MLSICFKITVQYPWMLKQVWIKRLGTKKCRTARNFWNNYLNFSFRSSDTAQYKSMAFFDSQSRGPGTSATRRLRTSSDKQVRRRRSSAPKGKKKEKNAPKQTKPTNQTLNPPTSKTSKKNMFALQPRATDVMAVGKQNKWKECGVSYSGGEVWICMTFHSQKQYRKKGLVAWQLPHKIARALQDAAKSPQLNNAAISAILLKENISDKQSCLAGVALLLRSRFASEFLYMANGTGFGPVRVI